MAKPSTHHEAPEPTATYEEALEAGYWGEHPDPLGNLPYTLEGVTGQIPDQVAKAKESAKQSAGKDDESKPRSGAPQ
jgi:hypothetical protein